MAGRGRLRVVSASALGRTRAEQRFGEWELKWGKLGLGTNIPGSSGVLTGRGSWNCPTLKNTQPRPLSASVAASQVCSTCREFPPVDFLVLGDFQSHLLSWNQSTHRSCQAYTRVTLSNPRDPG